MLYREFAEKVFHRRGNMLPAEEVAKKQGFCSIYAFQEDAAKEIIAQGNSKGLGRFPVWADKVVFDLDNGEEGLQELTAWCQERKLGYRIFSSGSKGFHLEVPHIPVLSRSLPYTHRLLAESTGVPCDPTLYQSGRLYRLEGTLHEKTGKPKQLVEEVEGENLLEIATREPPESRFKIRDVEDSELLPFFLNSVSNLINNSPGPGRRHCTLWGMAKDAGRCGLSYETTLELLLTANASWGSDSKDVDYVENACLQGWDR
jgi:hypothetical protein